MQKRKKISTKKIGKILLILLLLLGIGMLIFYAGKKLFTKDKTMYITSNTNKVSLYDESLKEQSTISRGSKIQVNENKRHKEDKNYYQITVNKKPYYVNKENITSDNNKLIKEERVFVRTPTVLLNNYNDIKIIENLTKGTELIVTSYDSLDEEGNIHMYKVKYNDKEGYVYAKYTTLTSEEATQTYALEKHSKIKNLFGGGSVNKLDFYPVTKPKFDTNTMPESVYSLYLNDTKQVISNVDKYIELAKNTKINAFVVDIKDNGAIAYNSSVMNEISKTSYKYANNTKEEYKEAIKKIKDAGFYVIGRITVFKDDYYVKDHPENAIIGTNTKEPYLIGKSYWPTAYSRDVWYYNVALALEAIESFGFNEINFDYVRFPDRTQSLEKNNAIDFKNSYNEDKVEAIQNYLRYATDAIHEKNAYVSVDVFGEASNNYYTTAYGQYWPAISNIVDVISAMPYPDHFANNAYGINKPWNHPYDLINAWSKEVVKRQETTTSPAVVRTWVQAYNVQSWVDPNGIEYNAEEVKAQIKALYDNGLKGGYITWHSGSRLDKYQKQIEAFQIDYLKDW